MKKYCKLLSILCTLLITTTGCSSNNHGLDANHPITISIWHYYSSTQKKVFDSFIEDFNQTVGKEKGIVVEATSMGSLKDLNDAITASANQKVGAKELPNMFSAYADTALALDSVDKLANLDTYLTSDEKENYMDAYIEEGTLDGEFKVFPIAKAYETMMLNKTDWDIFSQAMDVSIEQLSTWEGIAKVAEKYYTYSDGKAFFGRDAFANYMLVGSKQLGHPIITNNDGSITLDVDKDTMRKLWDNYYLPYIKGYYYSYGKFASDDMKTNDIIAFVGSTSGAAFFPHEVTLSSGEVYPIDYEILPLPNFANCEPYSIQQGAGIAVTTSDEAHEYACVVFLQWFTEAQRNLTFSSQAAYLPVLKEANDPALLKDALANTDMEVSPVVEDVILYSLQQSQTYTLYTSPNFEKSYDVRTLVETSMRKQAENDKAAIDEMITQGIPRETALQQYCDDSTFDTWYKDFKESLQAMIAPKDNK